jgi:hypothetical protein
MDIVSNGYYLFSWLSGFRNKLDKNIIIDPISCLVKLSLLKFYPVGCKIHIADNMITILEPNLTQGAYRFIKGDNREDLHNLYVPIIKSIEWFWDESNKEIKHLFEYAINGLENLKSSYPANSTITHTLDLYIFHLTTKQTKTLQNKEIKYKNPEKTENNEIHDFVKKLWNKREIHIIIELLLEYNSKQDEKHILDSILSLSAAKENKLKIFLKEHFASL